MVFQFLAHPLTRDKEIDAPETTLLRRRILQEKKFLRRIYQEWYATLRDSLSPISGKVLELGSGAGFFKEYLPELITSDILPLPGVDLVIDAQRLPFADQELNGITMVNVLHHLPQVGFFFVEAARCVRPGGKIAMLEPWVTSWSRWIYRNLHHEPFLPDQADWTFSSAGPVSGANGALPWILFERDRSRFQATFPQWRVESIKPTMPFRYLFSGGISLCSLMPAFTFGFWRRFENSLRRWHDRLAMFALIVLTRTERSSTQIKKEAA